MATIRTALRDTLAANVGSGVTVYKTPAGITSPAVLIIPTSAESQSMGRGVVQFEFDVQIVVDKGDLETAMDKFDALADPTLAGSVVSVLHDLSTGELAADTSVRSVGFTSYGEAEIEGVSYLAATVPVTVTTCR